MKDRILTSLRNILYWRQRKMDEKVKILMIYSGDAVEDGTMPVRELTPALIAFQGLVSKVNSILNNDDTTVEVKLSSNIRHGSFEMTLELVRTIPEEIKNLFFDTKFSISEILNFICFTSTITGINLLEIYRRIKQRKIEKIEEIDHSKKRIFVAGENFEVHKKALEIFCISIVRDFIETIIYPLTKDGIEYLEFRNISGQNQQIYKNESDYFFDDEQNKKVTEIKTTDYLDLVIITMNFENGLNWRFFDGKKRFRANVKDEKFLKDVSEGKFLFSVNDKIFVELEVIKKYYDGKFKSVTRNITKVFEKKLGAI